MRDWILLQMSESMQVMAANSGRRGALVVDVLMTFATVGLFFVAFLQYKRTTQRMDDERGVGLALRVLDRLGNASIVNDSRIDYRVSIKKWIVVTTEAFAIGDVYKPETTTEQLGRIVKLEEALSSSNNQLANLIKKMISNMQGETLVSGQVLSPGEQINFHMHAFLGKSEHQSAYMLLRFERNDHAKYQLFRFSGSGDVLAHNRMRGEGHPHGQWIRIAGFDDLDIVPSGAEATDL